MSEKTLGQIAYEAFVHSKECVPDWASSANQGAWEATARAVAERCAEVANRSMFVECDIYSTGYEEGKRDVKNAILDLCKVTP